MHIVAISGSNYNSSICIKKTHINLGLCCSFLETLFCTRSFISLLWVGSLNTLLTLPVEKDCIGKANPRSRGETGDIVLLNEI